MRTIATWIYLIATACIKLTLLFLYRRIFSPQIKNKIFIDGGICFVIGTSITLLVGTILQCSPVSRTWNTFMLESSCINREIFPYITGVVNSLTDIYILVLPIPILRRLNVNRKQKFRLAITFSNGVL